MAFIGIAATLLPHGKTVHKTFGLPVPLYHDSNSSLKAQSKEAQYLRETDVFFWDEAPASPRYALEIADRTLRNFANIDKPFGGKIMVLGGDFRQTLPIMKNSTKSEIINLSIKSSYLRPHFKVVTLTENMRVLQMEKKFVHF